NLFNQSSVLYKKPIIFTGVNSDLFLDPLEKDYITGVMQVEDNISLINMILNIHTEVTELNIILDNATYSQVVKNNLNEIQNFFYRPIKINFIQSEFIEDICNELSENENPNQASVIIGDFKSKITSSTSPPKDTIKQLQDISSQPIYTKSQPYVYAGTVGGTIDWGQQYGFVVGSILLRLSYGENIKDISPISDSLEQNVFNYKVIRKHNINPLLFPRNSVFINKNPFDFLLPKPLLILVWTIIFISFILILLLVYKFINHKNNATKNKRLYLEAQKAEKIKTEFIANVSHELRTPLNIILSTCKLLNIKIESSTLDNEYLIDKIYSIDKSSNRLLRLVNNILDVTKIETGFITAHFKVQNIVEIVEDTVLSVVDFAKSHNIDIVFDTEEEEILTAIDSIMLERALLNLLSNSIKFTKPSGFIDVYIKTKSNNVIIIIKDTGIGIPESYLPFIFERFKQVDTSFTRANEGSGLGLFIVKGIIELHNGTIIVDSEENHGSTFTITLPINVMHNETAKYVIDGCDLKQTVKLELSDIE
ncbi:MAG: ATP-binding protein, partial [Clostridium sp.]